MDFSLFIILEPIFYFNVPALAFPITWHRNSLTTQFQPNIINENKLEIDSCCIEGTMDTAL